MTRLMVPLLLALAVLCPSGASGQLAPPAHQALQLNASLTPRALNLPQELDTSLSAQMTSSGFFLGIVGMLGGAALGSGVGNAQCGKRCVTRSASGGAAIAGALMVPLGVHVAAKPRKNLALSMGTSVLAGSLVWAGFNAIPGRPVALVPFVAAPLQVWTSMKLETRARAELR